MLGSWPVGHLLLADEDALVNMVESELVEDYCQVSATIFCFHIDKINNVHILAQYHVLWVI